MTHHMISIVVAVLGLVLFIAGNGTNGVRLVELDLTGFTGGVDCKKESDQLEDAGCQECVEDGNGGSLSCVNAANRHPLEDHTGVGMTCAEYDTQCAGLAIHYYSDPECDGPNMIAPCWRTYRSWTCTINPGFMCN